MDRSSHTLAGQTVIVTGAAGFIGSVVMTALAAAGAKPFGWVRGKSSEPLQTAFPWANADLAQDPLDALLAKISPGAIIHCAGRTAAPDTDEGRADLFTANLTATARLVGAVSRMPQPARLVIVSSAAIWAPMAPDQGTIDEHHPMRPAAAYGVSKAAATLHALAEADRLGLDLAVAVPFNVIGPGQTARLVPQVFIEQLRETPGRFTLSNPMAVRDWIDVRDVATALVALSQPNGPRGLFNVASGEGHSLKDMLSALCLIGGWQPDIENGTQHNASGVHKSIGDPQRLIAATGWTRQIPLDTSLRDMIAFTAT
ncbi:NAD(P)-dependent oxidoreductase [Pseudotabrizicola sp.]|uniref:NAD-dependent epimerase/dehydratase family protein n=1 Tax=Pseudotabrizicola sp. TaxID=2939647 RepID=UPI00271FE8DB|nr:NAD(P)-dependent oxidoreductase [Pseudotabrizicola sp.]MDO8884472.1 NAD(P)-dependent oxidoreductase [Pseudotabrizicola sp.]